MSAGHNVRVFHNPQELPAEWEKARFEEPSFYSRGMLGHFAATIPVRQHCFLSEGEGGPAAGIFFETEIRSRYLGLRASVAVCRNPFPLPIQGCALGSPLPQVCQVLSDRGTDLSLVVLKGDPPPTTPPGWTLKKSLPNLVFKNEFADFRGYLASLKRDRRRSVLNAMSKWAAVDVKVHNCGSFGEQHYHLYREVWSRSKYRWPMLSHDLFSGFPVDHMLISAYAAGTFIGWILLLLAGDKAYAPLCGMDTSNIKSYDTWKNLHLQAIRLVIERKLSKLEMGETSTEAKLRLGCAWEPVYNLVRHRSGLGRLAIRLGPFFDSGSPNPPEKYLATKEQ
jgi:hypothetical protein